MYKKSCYMYKEYFLVIPLSHKIFSKSKFLCHLRNYFIVDDDIDDENDEIGYDDHEDDENSSDEDENGDEYIE